MYSVLIRFKNETEEEFHVKELAHCPTDEQITRGKFITFTDADAVGVRAFNVDSVESFVVVPQAPTDEKAKE
jgi:hypothetical protein